MPKLRHIAPSGTPITFADLAHWLFDGITGKKRTQALKSAICETYKVKHCFMMSSARAAMAMLFTLLKRQSTDPLRVEIILPSYTCYSVPAAAEIAGLTVRICDINPNTLSYNLDELSSIDFSKVLAIVSANLYGNPDDLGCLEDLAKSHGVYLIDDAAQSMHATQKDRYAGTFGDVGLYSLDKGKNITSIQGGIIVTNDDNLALLIEDEIANLPVTSLSQKFSEAVKLLIYSIFLHPRLYWIPANISALGLGKTVYTTDYLFTRYSEHLASISLRLFSRISQITDKRKHNAASLHHILQDIQGIRFIEHTKDSSSSCLRFPIIVEDREKRQQLVKALNESGIGATTSYPCSIADLDEVKSFSIRPGDNSPGGKYIAHHVLTLPTTPNMNGRDLSVIKSVFTRILDEK